MCGRFTLTNPDPALLASTFNLTAAVDAPLEGLTPRYNIAPTQTVAAVVRDAGTSGPLFNRLTRFKWGLIPSWAKDASGASRLINARAETVAEKPNFRTALSRRRCLIVADGFYEWQGQPDGTKIPMYVRMADDSLFGLAGLWETWTDRASGETIPTCTIITLDPNVLMAPIHDRMPAIIPREAYEQWLDPQQTDGRQVTRLLQSFPAEQMVAWPVSRRVNNVRLDDATLIEKAAG